MLKLNGCVNHRILENFLFLGESGLKWGHVLMGFTIYLFYLWLNGIGHMVKNHSDERKPAAAT